MEPTWIVVADSARARFFRRGSRWQEMEEVEVLTHPESRLHDGDLKTGGEGRQYESSASASRATDPQVSPSEKEAADFAREVAAKLQDARTGNHYKKLVLVAPPKFLGLLRDTLDAATATCITQELDKNLVQHEVQAIRDTLEDNF